MTHRVGLTLRGHCRQPGSTTQSLVGYHSPSGVLRTPKSLFHKASSLSHRRDRPKKQGGLSLHVDHVAPPRSSNLVSDFPPRASMLEECCREPFLARTPRQPPTRPLCRPCHRSRLPSLPHATLFGVSNPNSKLVRLRPVPIVPASFPASLLNQGIFTFADIA